MGLDEFWRNPDRVPRIVDGVTEFEFRAAVLVLANERHPFPDNGCNRALILFSQPVQEARRERHKDNDVPVGDAILK